MGSVFGPAWQAENDCLSVKHPIVASKLQALQQSHAEAQAAVEQAVADGPCCEDCQKTADEWARFEAERPTEDSLSALDRVIRAEKEAQDERAAKVEREAFGPIDGWFGFTPDVDEAPHPVACGGGENPLTLAIRESNSRNASVERRPA